MVDWSRRFSLEAGPMSITDLVAAGRRSVAWRKVRTLTEVSVERGSGSSSSSGVTSVCKLPGVRSTRKEKESILEV